ncbi:hypothetical protein K2P56_01385 [Patescibacteria group bacterium]|nr:hypothetical protein [Patescibacteria group bacterium]
MSYPEQFDPVGVQVKITGLKRQEKTIPVYSPQCDWTFECRRDAAFECTPDGGGPFYRCHEHHPHTL